jgi:hypothetical protein
MPNRVIGNNTSFTISSFASGRILSSFVWNSMVATNLAQMQTVVDRVPAVYVADVLGTTNAAGAGSWVGTTVRTRQMSVLSSWINMPTFSENGNNKFHIYPKHIASGPTVLNTFSNYFVFYTPGIYNIELNLTITDNQVGQPTLIRIALVPYFNNGGNYHMSPPFDSPTTVSNNSDYMLNFLLAYTGRLNIPTGGTVNNTVSGMVVVTSQTVNNTGTYFNNAINTRNPLLPGNAYHFEIEGMYANLTEYNANTPRFTVNSGTLRISLIQEWWK